MPVLLDVARDDDWLHPIERRDAASLAPIKELLDRLSVSKPRVLVANRDGEEFEEAANAFVTCGLNGRRAGQSSPIRVSSF